MFFPQCTSFTNRKDFRGISNSCFFLLSPSHSVHDEVFFFCYFNRAFFLQCSHVTSMQSPYVLKSNVVNNRRILHKVSQLNKDAAKMTLHSQTHTHTNRSSDGNLLWCTFLHSAYSHRYLMSAFGGELFLEHL